MDSSRTSTYRPVKIIEASRISPARLALVQFLLVAIILTALFQLAQLSLFYQPAIVERAVNQNRLVVDIPPMRGALLDRYGQGLAINLRVPSIYAVPRLLTKEEKQTLTRQLAEALSLSPSYIRERLERNKAFVWIKRRASTEEAKKVEAIGQQGLGILHEYKRFYPHGQLLANVIGFTNVDNQGLEGIERLLYH